ncbi:protein kinase [Streptomyces sp. SID8379]|uniref:serine/threonine-protein kinase n=1 Tax=unclassified Streptomyces TaxID=2593676 RepID=UPI00036634FA|nr:MULTISPECIES: serine/threonine-protein kinase [unclassified Streptomyces]MYW68933.1 protein kinase [Streptomyces sp. SID8379]
MGEVFAGRYELADPIGRGGVGAVWRAWDHRRRRYVAAKVLQQSDAHTLLRFVREQALRIDHPHVLAPASWAADDDKVLFTMDLVGGGSLAHLIGDYGPLPPQFVCLLLDQLLAGLAAVHAEGVVHRDIKPANILLEATGTGLPHLRLSDFGIAMRKGEPRLTEANYVVGTPGYIAPEQALGAEPDFPADLFAAGLVALYLLEGAKPDSKALIEHFAEHGTPGPPQGIPGPLWGVLAGLLQPDPEARFRTATGARKALLAATELLPEPGPDDELIEVFDQLGPLPPGFSPEGPATRGRRARPLHATTPSPPAIMPERPVSQPSQALAQPFTPPPPPPSVPPTPPPIPAPIPAPTTEPESGVEGPPQSAPEPPLPSMSETGSFHLPPPAAPEKQLPPPPSVPPPMPSVLPAAPLPEPPRAQPPSAPTGAQAPTPTPTPTPTTAPAQDPLPAPRPEPAPEPHAPTPTPRVKPSVPVVVAPHVLTSHPASAATTVIAHDHDRHSLYTAQGREVPQRRPGPPPKVTIPVLLLAVLCFAVGIWALTQA